MPPRPPCPGHRRLPWLPPAAALLLLALSFLPAAAGAAAPATARDRSPLDPERWKALSWREVGPYRGGRSAAVTGVPGDRATYYFGAAGGGVWKTTDGGRRWRCVSDGFFGGGIGDVAVAASDPNVIYAGTGEVTVRGNVSEGDGMWKSTDAGKTWKRAGLRDSRHITRIRIHPANPDLVYAAVLGHLFGPNPERGVYRSTDGGASWKRVLSAGDAVGAFDLAMDPVNPRVLYASTWRVRRTPYSLESGGPGSGLWKTTDGGDSWTELSHNPGLPKGALGVIGVSVSRTDPDNVYALVEAADGGLFRSRDGGKTWKLASADHELRQRAWYYSRVFADPADADSVYVTNVLFMHSKDGGKSFANLQVPHGDNHDLWIDPGDPRRMIESNDGGANVSEDGGRTWTRQDNQPTAQIYRVSTDSHFPYRIYGAQQDNSALRIASRGDGPGIGWRDWEPTAGGESGYVLADPRNPEVVYGGSYGGFLQRYDHTTHETRDVNPWPDNPMGAGAGELLYRFQWNFPVALSPHDPKVLYTGANVLFRSTDEGESWTAISPDLTRNDKSKQGPSGGPITKDNTSVEYYDTLFAIAESPLAAGVLWVGSDDGLVHLSRDGGGHWLEVTPPGLPAWAQINSIEPSPFDAAAAYFAATLYKSDDQHPYLWKTADYGRHWTRIDAGIDPTHFTRVVRADPARRGLLYAGTQGGVYVSFDDGSRWRPLQGNLPRVPVTDLTVKEGDLVAATEGRGFWVLDDLAPLRELAAAPGLVDAPVHLFTPRPAYRITGGEPPEDVPGLGKNPPAGAIIDYYLRDAPVPGQAPLRIEILDREGKLVRRFTAAKAGTGPAGKAAAPAGKGGAAPAPAAAGAEAKAEARAAREAGAGAAAGPATNPRTSPAAGEAGVAMAVASAPATGPAPAAAGAGAGPAKPAEKGEEAEAGEAEAEAGAEAGGTTSLSAELTRPPEEAKPPAEQGFNRFAWDLAYAHAKGFPGIVLWARDLIAPVATAGAYQVRLTAGGRSTTVPLTLVKDPRSRASDADLEAQLRFLLGIRDELDAAHDALRRIRAVRAQIADLRKRLRAATELEGEEGGDGAPVPPAPPAPAASAAPAAPAAPPSPAGEGDRYAAVRRAARELEAKLTAVEETLYQTKLRSIEDALNYPIRLDDKLNWVAVSTAFGDHRPTAQAIAVRDRLVAAIDAQLAKLAAVFDHELAAFNQLAAGAGVQTLIPPRPRPASPAAKIGMPAP
jgi:photosystem II stability/assembly factor-like uncharacterized protein